LPDGAAAPLERRGPLTWWKVELAPYDAAGAILSSSEARVVDYLATLPTEALDELRGRIRDIGARQYQLRDVQAQAYTALSNPGFEQPAPDGQIPGWQHQGAWGSVTLDANQPYEGTTSLHLKSPTSQAATWIRSEVLKPPPSGEVTFSVWVRTADAAQQPELRLSAQWMHRGALIYKPAVFGHGSQFPLTTEWREYLIHVPLPAADVSDLRVGVDLYGPGEVWIDGVRLYDPWFKDTERDELMKLYGGAETDLSHHRIANCLRFLEGYWPRFLQTYVEPPPPQPAETPVVEPPAPAQKPKMLDRFRRWSPRRLWPF
jgi:hypothetical protein